MDKEQEKAILSEIESKIKDSCSVSKYTNLCQRISSEAGLAWAVNRCIRSMADDKIHLSSALANLESELEGMD